MAKKSNNLNPATVDTIEVLSGYETGLDLLGFCAMQQAHWDVTFNLLRNEVEALGGKVDLSVEDGDLLVSVVGSFEGKDIARAVAERLEKADAIITLDKKAAVKLIKAATACVPKDIMDCLHWYQASREWTTTGKFTEQRKVKGKFEDKEIITKRSLLDCYVEFFTNLGMGRVTPVTAKKFGMRIIERAYTGKVDSKAGSHKFKAVSRKQAERDALNCVLNYFLDNGWRLDRDDNGEIIRDEDGNTKSVKCGGGYILEKNTDDTPFMILHTVDEENKPQDVELAVRRPANYVLKRA